MWSYNAKLDLFSQINADAEKEEGEEFEDNMDVFDDSSSSPSGTLRNYPLTCKVVYSYKVCDLFKKQLVEKWIMQQTTYRCNVCGR